MHNPPADLVLSAALPDLAHAPFTDGGLNLVVADAGTWFTSQSGHPQQRSHRPARGGDAAWRGCGFISIAGRSPTAAQSMCR